MKYEISHEERWIIMLACAGFELDRSERATIRPLYMKMFNDAIVEPLKPEIDRCDPEIVALHVACPLCKAQPGVSCIGVREGDPIDSIGKQVSVHNSRVEAGAKR